MKFKKMRTAGLLIKPASAGCNLRCAYCFYFDVADNRAVKSYGNMSYETLENLIKNVFDHVEKSVSFMFQGGEPTMRGIDFFYKLHELVEKYNVNRIPVSFAIQTNGTLLNEKWISLFQKEKYLVGISIDGTKEIHDLFRVDAGNHGTFDRILDHVYQLSEAGVEYNVLSVVNSEVAKHGKEIYRFFKASGFRHLQFIPALDPLKDEEEKVYTLTPKQYGIFLDEVFGAWYEDILKRDFYAIRYYENLLLILMGREPESCDMVGRCTANPVVEADGSVYACDFYVLDEKRLGNINTDSLVDILFSEKAVEFVKESYPLHEKCKACRYLKLCRGGCKRHKNAEHYNKFCESYLYFFDRNLDKLIRIKNLLQNGF